MNLTQAHFGWLDYFTKMSASELKDYAQEIQEVACELGIWQHGGYVPVQPFVVHKSAADQLDQIGAKLGDLVVSHALETSESDMSRLADIAELAAEDRWFLSAKRPLGQALGCRRSDVFVSSGKPFFLEVNFGTCLNGASATPVLSTSYLESPMGREMQQRYNIAADSFFAARTAWVQQHLSSTSSSTALIGFSSEGNEGSLKVFEVESAYMSDHGVPCDFVPAEEAEICNGYLTWRDKRYETAIRYFMVTEKMRRDHFDFVVALEHAPHTRLLGAYVSQLFTSKALLADLYQDSSLSARHRRLLEHVPWTARLREGFAWRGEERIDPVAWAAENRERAVLKPFNQFGSRGILVGHLFNESEWISTLETAVVNGGYIIQELVKPDYWSTVYWKIAEQALVHVDSPVLVAPFDIEGRSGGCFTKQPISGAAEDLLNSKNDISFGCVISAALSPEGHGEQGSSRLQQAG